MGKFLTLLIVSLPILFGNSIAQNQEELPNRLSLGIYSTLTKGHLNTGSAFQSGAIANFEFEEQFTNTVGFNIRYVPSSELALQANVGYGSFRLLSEFSDEQDLFLLENKYLTTSFSTQLSLLRLFGSNSQNFNIYSTIGAGLMFNNVSIEADNPADNRSNISTSDHPFQTFFTSFGGGLRFNLGPRIDSFAQYEYNVANRDIIDGDFLGQTFNLNSSTKTSNSWSVLSFGIQIKFGSGKVDADWPSPLLPPGQSSSADRDVFEELGDKLQEHQEKSTEQRLLNTRLDSLRTRLETENYTVQESDQIYFDIINELIDRIESLEQEIENEKAKSDGNLQKIDTLTNQVESLRSELADEQLARRELEELYKENIAELQRNIDSLESELSRNRNVEQIGQATIDSEASDTTEREADTEGDHTSTPVERKEEDNEPHTVARKEVESSTEIAGRLATEIQPNELPEGDDADEETLAESTNEPGTVSNELEISEYSSADDDSVSGITADSDTDMDSGISDADAEEAETAEDEQSQGMMWVFYTILALLAAIIVYFVSKIFAPKDDSGDDRGNGKGGGPSSPSISPDDSPAAPKTKSRDTVSYPVPEHSRTVDRSKSVSKSSLEKDNISKLYSTGSHSIPEYSVVVNPKKSKFSTSELNQTDSKITKNKQKEAKKEFFDKNDDASTGFFALALTEATDFFGTLFSLKPKKK